LKIGGLNSQVTLRASDELRLILSPSEEKEKKNKRMKADIK